MAPLYNLKLDRTLGVPTLPEASDTLAKQRAVARALRLLYPGIGVELVSVRVQDGKRVVRELEV